MTVSFQNFAPTAALMADEDVVSQVQRWQAEGQRVVLVTLVTVEGGAPRQAGDQMAVAQDGRFAGYLSGGCLEAAVVHEAQAVMTDGRNRLVRYGKGSPYFDIKLPCGSGLDLYFDQDLDPAQVSSMMELRARRQPFALKTDLKSGTKTVRTWDQRSDVPQSLRDGETFTRVYPPSLRLILLGNGPALTGMAALAATLGIDMVAVSTDDATRAALAASRHRVEVADTLSGMTAEPDFATAAVLFLHEHDKEPDILARLLKTPCFYIGALGNHAVHRTRLTTLEMRGFGKTELQRIRAPVGSIAGAKSKATLAVGIFAEILAQAKALNLVS
jgi:xanthine dehydrogenase accessory factor